MIHYGECVGLAFQVVDDILDQDGYLAFIKESEAVEKARDLIANAKREVRIFGDKGKHLTQLADFLLERLEKANDVSVDS